jgi:hypothetical protein
VAEVSKTKPAAKRPKTEKERDRAAAAELAAARDVVVIDKDGRPTIREGRDLYDLTPVVE